MNAKAIAHIGMVLLAVLVVAWYGWLQPPELIPPLLAIAITGSVLVPGLLLLVIGHRRAAFAGALGALVLFCHGIAEGWSAPQTRLLGTVEAILSVVVIVGASLDGLRARFANKRGV